KNNRTLLRIMSQPIPRDYLILAKFTGGLLVISYLVFILGMLIFASSLLIIGLPPTFEEFIRIVVYLIVIILYIGFWLLFSILFKQAATSALSGIAVWLFFSIFYSIIVRLMINASMPDQLFQSLTEQMASQEKIAMFMRISPNYLFSEITTVLLNPEFRS